MLAPKNKIIIGEQGEEKRIKTSITTTLKYNSLTVAVAPVY